VKKVRTAFHKAHDAVLDCRMLFGLIYSTLNISLSRGFILLENLSMVECVKAWLEEHTAEIEVFSFPVTRRN